MNINATLLVQALSFAALIWFTVRFVWPSLTNAIDDRNKRIADGLAAAEKGRQALELSSRQADEALKEARARAAEILAQADKRAAELQPLSTTLLDREGSSLDRDVVAVHDALLAFENVDARAAKVVELRYFGGLELEEIGEALGVSLATIKRDWAVARAWLRRELGGTEAGGPSPSTQQATF